jgi:hypothetical protein
MQLHTLKTWPDHFTALRLAEWDPDTSRFTDRMLLRRVTHLHRGFGLEGGYVVLSLTDVEDAP